LPLVLLEEILLRPESVRLAIAWQISMPAFPLTLGFWEVPILFEILTNSFVRDMISQ
jgi:hypothetical protein